MKATEVFVAFNMLAIWFATSSYAKKDDTFRILMRIVAFASLVFFVQAACR